MKDLNRILEIEANNRSAIHLYNRENRWQVYEHSAYHFALMFGTDSIENPENNRITIRIDNQLNFLYSQAMDFLQVTLVGDSEIEIECGTTFADFDRWKKNRIFNHNRKTGSTPDVNRD